VLFNPETVKLRARRCALLSQKAFLDNSQRPVVSCCFFNRIYLFYHPFCNHGSKYLSV
jgi:hypothetical protein